MKTLSAISSRDEGARGAGPRGRAPARGIQGGATTSPISACTASCEFSAIINPPQATILAVGAAERVAFERPDGGVNFAGQHHRTLSCDHRVVDGVLGAELLAAFKTGLEQPITMLV